MRFSKVKDVKSPVRGTDLSAGIDFFIPNDWNDGKEYLVSSQQQVLIPSGIHIDLPGSGLKDHALVFENKSGIATKKHLLVGAKIIDSDYQGQIHINVHNVGSEAVRLNPGDKIIQGLLLKVNYDMPEEIKFSDLYSEETERGAGGFGSTGDK